MISTKKNRKQFLKRETYTGNLFCLPFIIGIIFFLISPLIQSIMISFGDIDSEKGYEIIFQGLDNYKKAIGGDPDFLKNLYNSLIEALLYTPLIVIVSFVVANLLKREFPGRTIFRVIFFLPVIFASGVMSQITTDELIANIINPSVSYNGLSGTLSGSQQFISELLLSIDISPKITEYILYAQSNIATILNYSGIQILIFLAALQSISPSLYEASAIEGATAWENFWKITLPMVSPQLLVIIIYTVIERYVNINNGVMSYIYSIGFGDMKFGYSTAMAWIYFLIIGVIVAILYFILKKLTVSTSQE